MKVINRSLFQKPIFQIFIERTFIYGIQQFCIPKYWIVLVRFFEVQRNQTRHPSVAVDDIRWPSEFSDGFHNAFAEKHHPFSVVTKYIVFLVFEHLFSSEKLIVVEEINLQPGPG